MSVIKEFETAKEILQNELEAIQRKGIEGLRADIDDEVLFDAKKEGVCLNLDDMLENIVDDLIQSIQSIDQAIFRLRSYQNNK